MNRVLWVLPLTALVAGCSSKPEKAAVKPETVAVGPENAAAVLDVPPGPAVRVERAGAIDPVVPVSGPSNVYVIQGKRVVAVIPWRHGSSGRVTVPLKAVDDGSGPLFIVVTTDPMPVLGCPPCHGPGPVRDDCCPLQ